MNAPRPRRLRGLPAVRRLVRETRLSADSLIYPLFVRPGNKTEEPIPSMPGQSRISLDRVPYRVEEIQECGLSAVLLFGLPVRKDEAGSEAGEPRGIVQETVRAIKKAAPGLCVITDLCLCAYTSHGHCGLARDGAILNDETVARYREIALAQAAAGADFVAPSGMMDGQVAAIRSALDGDGFTSTGILAYAAKFASAFYGPFRDAVDSTPRFGDRKTMQIDPPNGREALREMELDLAEGADILMVKPALAYLDILARARERFGVPLAAYSVSGEYAAIKAAAERGWIDERSVALETLTAIHRAGADLIITYFALEAAKWLKEERT